MQRRFVVFAPGIGVEGVLLIIERDTRADNVEYGDAVVAESGFEEFFDLLGVAREGARHESGIGGQRLHANIHRHVRVDTLVFQVQAHLGGGRELAFGQAVDAVVLDDVNNRRIAAHHVFESAHANGGRVTVAGDADGAH